jgi:hypothetical protein
MFFRKTNTSNCYLKFQNYKHIQNPNKQVNRIAKLRRSFLTKKFAILAFAIGYLGRSVKIMKNKLKNIKKLIDQGLKIYESPQGENNPEINCIWDSIVDLLGSDFTIIKYILSSLTEEELSFISEVFDDIAENYPSQELLHFYEELQVKHQSLDLAIDIQYARNYINKKLN